jgi:hypothetical protein
MLIQSAVMIIVNYHVVIAIYHVLFAFVVAMVFVAMQEKERVEE